MSPPNPPPRPPWAWADGVFSLIGVTSFFMVPIGLWYNWSSNRLIALLVNGVLCFAMAMFAAHKELGG